MRYEFTIAKNYCDKITQLFNFFIFVASINNSMSIKCLCFSIKQTRGLLSDLRESSSCLDMSHWNNKHDWARIFILCWIWHINCWTCLIIKCWKYNPHERRCSPQWHVMWGITRVWSTNAELTLNLGVTFDSNNWLLHLKQEAELVIL